MAEETEKKAAAPKAKKADEAAETASAEETN